ncbi:MAG: hypothetical protein ACXWKH_20180, partial [Limisphaerales bacterium]
GRHSEGRAGGASERGPARVGIGPILGNGENDKATIMYRPTNRSNNGAAFIVLQERDDFTACRRAYWHLKIRLAARLAVGNVVTAECPLSGEQRKRFAQFEFFRF